MAVKSSYEYDRTIDVVLNPSQNVQVVMARGLIENWKQPVFYNFDCKMTAKTLNKIIIALNNIGYTTVAIVSDMSTSNQNLWKELGIGIMNSWFKNPADNNKNIYVFADAPHLLKLVRNHFLDDGFIIEDKFITSEPIEEALNKLGVDDLRIINKISYNHLTVKGPHRQKVKTAAQLMSHSVSSGLRRCLQLGELKSKNVLECSNFIKSINDWFDILNSKVFKIDSRDRMKAYGLALETQNKILNNVDSIMLNITTPKRKAMLPFQKGILVTNSSLRKLFTYLKEKYNVEFILTNRINQDILENFFATIRGKGGLYDHPSNLEFKYRLRSFLLGNVEEIS